MYVVCRRLVRPSRSRAPPSLSLSLSLVVSFRNFSLFRTFHLNVILLHRYKEHFVSQTLQGGHDGTKTTRRFLKTRGFDSRLRCERTRRRITFSPATTRKTVSLARIDELFRTVLVLSTLCLNVLL